MLSTIGTRHVVEERGSGVARDVRIKGVWRDQIDEDKLALAFLLMAQRLVKERHADCHPTDPRSGRDDRTSGDQEAA